MYQQRRAVQATFFGIPVLCLLNKQTPRVLDLLELLLHAELVRVAALLLAAVGRTRREARVAPGMRVDQNWSKYNGGNSTVSRHHDRINASSDAKARRLPNTLCTLSSQLEGM